MTTTTRQPGAPIPAWLNLEALGIDDAAVTQLVDINAQLLEIVGNLDDLLARAAAVDFRLEENWHGKDFGDDVLWLLMDYSGRQELWDLLGLLETMAVEITSGAALPGGMADPEARRRLGAEWPVHPYRQADASEQEHAEWSDLAERMGEDE